MTIMSKKNEEVYKMYAIDGFPCHFFTIEATYKYNEKIEKWSKKLKKNATDLTSFMKLKRYIFIRYLDFYDVIISIKKMSKKNKVSDDCQKNVIDKFIACLTKDDNLVLIIAMIMPVVGLIWCAYLCLLLSAL